MARILVVEDDAILAEAYRIKLSAKYDVRIAPSGEDGVRQVEKWSPDVVLLDLYLSSSMDGVDVLRQIKKNINTRKVPVLVVTNLPDMERVVLDLGANKCLMKSDIDLNGIAGFLDDLLDKSQV
jgi:DNA-binding response OmpR family regulator